MSRHPLLLTNEINLKAVGPGKNHAHLRPENHLMMHAYATKFVIKWQ